MAGEAAADGVSTAAGMIRRTRNLRAACGVRWGHGWCYRDHREEGRRRRRWAGGGSRALWVGEGLGSDLARYYVLASCVVRLWCCASPDQG